eukprot:scaffold1234_cov345-Pavlova_lutheri.AAC.3
MESFFFWRWREPLSERVYDTRGSRSFSTLSRLEVVVRETTRFGLPLQNPDTKRPIHVPELFLGVWLKQVRFGFLLGLDLSFGEKILEAGRR